MSTDSTAVVANLPQAVAPARPRLNRAAVILAFLSIYLIWGSTYLAIRYAVETIPPLYTAGLRHLTAGTILLLWCLAKRLRPTWAQIRASFVIGVFFFLIGHGTLHWAEQKVPSGLASLLIASEPIWVFLLSALAARQWRLNATLFTGILLGFGGVGLLMGRSALNSGPGVFVGSVAVVLGALSWSVGIVYSRRSHLSGHPWSARRSANTADSRSPPSPCVPGLRSATSSSSARS
jgi:drug/metabolite transporter (DMT)-like permease